MVAGFLPLMCSAGESTCSIRQKAAGKGRTVKDTLQQLGSQTLTDSPDIQAHQGPKKLRVN